MRALLISATVLAITGCSHSPPLYTAKTGLLKGNHLLNVPKQNSEQIDISAEHINIDGKQFEIAERYTSALRESCIRLMQQGQRHPEAPSAICRQNQGSWYVIDSLN